MNNRLKYTLVVLAVLLVGFIGWTLISLIAHAGQAKLQISVAPDDSKVTLDGHPAKAGTAYVTPGHHSLVASRKDFKDAKQSIDAKKGSPNEIFLILSPANQDGLNYLNDHPEQQKLREQLAAKQVDQIQVAYKSKYPIINSLPIDTRRFSINYGISLAHPDDPTAIALYVTSLPEDRNLAIDWLKYKGYDSAKFEIIYKNP